MSQRRLIEHNPFTGVTEWHVGSEDGKSFQIVYEQDAEPFIESNKTKQSMGKDYYARDPDMWRVASIPVGIQMKWLIEHNADVYKREDWPKIRKLLNDPEWRYLKTAEIII